ncbi:MAG: prepilin-type N-terminal cleavage/methylation domain-containing protein [Phycisphaerales bacterium]|nr:prepilin-type N-terminal cleavage/methylation domain-containing protein [Phycisphaerales bacterium]
MPARAFTLIEILVAVSILLLMAAVVVPFTDATLAERRFENTMDRVSGHLLSARLEAMERRLPVEVTWDTGRLRTRIFDPDVVQSIPLDDSGGGFQDEFEDDEPSLDVSADDAGSLIEELELPEGTDCRESRPEDFSDDVDEEWLPVAETDTLRIAVFLPDGSVIERGPRWLVDRDGRLAAVWIDHRTGLPAIHRRYRLDDTDEPVDDEEDPGFGIPAIRSGDGPPAGEPGP